MLYTPKLPEENINAPKVNFLLEALKLLTSLIMIVVVCYAVLWSISSYLVSSMSPTTEKRVQIFFKKDLNLVDDNRTTHLQYMADSLKKCTNLPYDVEVLISKNDVANAYAFIGGDIVVTTKMLDTLKSDKELLFLLGHELGHFKNRDHLRQLGTSLIIGFLSIFIGEDYSDILSFSIGLTSTKFSQQQEIEADLYGIDMMMCELNDAKEATKLFERMQENSSENHYFSSHPDFKDRIEIMKQKINSLP